MAEKKYPVLTTDSVTGKSRPRTPEENAKYKAIDDAQAAKLRKEIGMSDAPAKKTKPAATKTAAKPVATKPAAKPAAKAAAKPAAKPAAKKAAPAKKK